MTIGPLVILENPKFGSPRFESSTYAQLAGDTSVRGRLSPITPTRCYPVALGLKLQESVSNFGSRAKFHFLIEKVPNFGNPQFESSIYAKLAVETNVRGRVSPIKPTSCYPVTLGFQPEESVSNSGHRAKLNVLIIEIPKFVCLRFNPSTYAQLAGGTVVRDWVSPITPTTCYPVALGLKQQESVSNRGPGAKFHILI